MWIIIERRNTQPERKARMLCCLLAALSAGNLAVVARIAVRLATERTGAMAIALAAGLGGLAALSPFVIEHTATAHRARIMSARSSRKFSPSRSAREDSH
jgi:hypothetical protein